jgi:CheY-like chemotaxis protein
LVVEDDEDVLLVAAENLTELGYHVETAVNAAQALEILRGDDPVDLLFSDVIMPGGMNGVQLAVEARRIRPELKVLLTSGYTATALSREHGLPDNLNVVENLINAKSWRKNSGSSSGDRSLRAKPARLLI